VAWTDAPTRIKSIEERPSPIPVFPRASAAGTVDCVSPSAGSEEPEFGVARGASATSAAAAESTSSRTSRRGAAGSMSDGVRETTSEIDFSGGAKTGAASAAGATTVWDTDSATRPTAVSARDATGAVTCAGRASDDLRVSAAASTGATVSATREGTYLAAVTEAGAALAGTASGGVAAGTGAIDAASWVARDVASTAFKARAAMPGLSVPLLLAEVAGAMTPPMRVSPAGWVLASAAGAEKDSQATATAPAMRTGRNGRSIDQDDILLAMLDTPRYANNSIIVYSLSLKESGSPELSQYLSIEFTGGRHVNAECVRRWGS
jgi:hypothetical protein